MNLSRNSNCCFINYNYYFGGITIIELKGQVFSINSGFYDIYSNNKIYRVRGSGNLRNTNQSPLVGDFVIFEKNGFVKKILERKNFLIRPKVANINQIIIVCSLKEPDLKTFILDKFLLIIEAKDIHPVILFTKKDLVNEQPQIPQMYYLQGYEVYVTSKNDEKTFTNFAAIFKNKLSAFTGLSGVGKTTIINKLTKNNFETQQISKFLGRGKHTTRITQIIPFNNGWLVDTPGFSIFEHNLDKHEIANAYHDFREFAKKCEFRNCLHYKEKKCEVKKQVEAEKSLNSRYKNYIKILKEVENEVN